MFSALLFLQYHSWKNRLRVRLKRLKSPKYLVGALVGGGYVLFYLGILLFSPEARAGDGSAPVGPSALGENFGAFLLLAVVALGWLVPNERAALAFSEAEIAFLFPAPVTRQNLLHYKLVRSQTAIFFSTILLTLVSGRWMHPGHAWIALLGWWIILSTLNLHLLAASFARTALLDRGLTNWRRRGLVLLLLLAGVALVAQGGWPPLPANGAGLSALMNWGKEVLVGGNLPYLLYPFRLVVAPYMAPEALAFLVALGPALAILAAHYFLVMRAKVAFEEASVEYSQKLASRISAARANRIPGAAVPKKARRAPFRLAPTGHPAVAFLWKNLLLAGHAFNARSLIFLIWIMVVLYAVFLTGPRHSSGSALVGILALGLLLMSVFLAPNWLRFDFRADLESAELLKMYPVPGWKIVLGEVMAPVVVLVVLQWLLIGVAALLFELPEGRVPMGLRMGCVLGAAAFAAALGLVMFIIPNAAALLMPGWVRLGKDGARGFESFGQVIVLMIGQMAAMLVALLPAGLVFFVVFVFANLATGPAAAIPLAALAAALILMAEAAIAIYLLGKVFERFDLSAELSQ